MNRSFKIQVIDSFNRAAVTYDSHALTQKQAAYQLFKQIEYLSPKTVLEIGCGTGFLTDLIQKKFTNTNYIISDIASEMVKRCKSKYSKAHSSFLVCDGENLPLSQELDLIVANLAFQWFEDIEGNLQKLLKQTKTLAFSILIDGTFEAWKQAHQPLAIKSNIVPMHTCKDLEKMCKKLSPHKLEINTQVINIRFANAAQFIKSLRYIGATTSYCKYSPSSLKKLLKLFENGININYNLAYCLIRR